MSEEQIKKVEKRRIKICDRYIYQEGETFTLEELQKEVSRLTEEYQASLVLLGMSSRYGVCLRCEICRYETDAEFEKRAKKEERNKEARRIRKEKEKGAQYALMEDADYQKYLELKRKFG